MGTGIDGGGTAPWWGGFIPPISHYADTERDRTVNPTLGAKIL